MYTNTPAGGRPYARTDIPALPFCHWRLTAPKVPPEGYPERPKSLGEHLKKRRIDLGLHQADVARLVGVNKWTVLNWESGKTAPEVRYYPRIISFLGHNPLPRGETFQEQLRAARQARGLSWKRLAQELGVWESTVRDWENGVHSPTGRKREAVLRFISLPSANPASATGRKQRR